VAYEPRRVVKALGKKIAELRRARGMSQGDFATKIRSTPQWVSQLERGMRSPTIDTLCKVANALDMSLSDLLAGAPGRT
jgi:transcriptional regulator with XRE-family HTH domain